MCSLKFSLHHVGPLTCISSVGPTYMHILNTFHISHFQLFLSSLHSSTLHRPQTKKLLSNYNSKEDHVSSFSFLSPFSRSFTFKFSFFHSQQRHFSLYEWALRARWNLFWVALCRLEKWWVFCWTCNDFFLYMLGISGQGLQFFLLSFSRYEEIWRYGQNLIIS